MAYTVQGIKTGDLIAESMLTTMDEGIAANSEAIEELEEHIVSVSSQLDGLTFTVNSDGSVTVTYESDDESDDDEEE